MECRLEGAIHIPNLAVSDLRTRILGALGTGLFLNDHLEAGIASCWRLWRTARVCQADPLSSWPGTGSPSTIFASLWKAWFMLCLLEMKAAKPGILFSTETDMAPRVEEWEEGSRCNVLLLYLFYQSLQQSCKSPWGSLR